MSRILKATFVEALSGTKVVLLKIEGSAFSFIAIAGKADSLGVTIGVNEISWTVAIVSKDAEILVDAFSNPTFSSPELAEVLLSTSGNVDRYGVAIRFRGLSAVFTPAIRAPELLVDSTWAKKSSTDEKDVANIDVSVCCHLTNCRSCFSREATRFSKTVSATL